MTHYALAMALLVLCGCGKSPTPATRSDSVVIENVVEDDLEYLLTDGTWYHVDEPDRVIHFATDGKVYFPGKTQETKLESAGTWKLNDDILNITWSNPSPFQPVKIAIKKGELTAMRNDQVVWRMRHK